MTGTLFDLDAHGVDDTTLALLQLMSDDVVHAADRRKIVTAIVEDARGHSGIVCPNRLRRALTNERTKQLDVTPQVIGAVVRILARRNVLRPHGHVASDDHASRNAGRLLRRWRYVPGVAA